MKRIRRSISPVLIAGLGVWFLLKQNASMESLGIAGIVLSGLGIVLSVTDKESTKVSKGLHIGVDGVLAAGGVWLLAHFVPISFEIGAEAAVGFGLPQEALSYPLPLAPLGITPVPIP